MMKIARKTLAVLSLAVCMVGCGCGEKDLRLFQEDLSATVDGEIVQPIYYTPSKHDNSVQIPTYGMDSVFNKAKDNAVTLEGASHDVTLTFTKIKPKFDVDDVSIIAILGPPGELPEGSVAVYWYEECGFPISNFEYEKGKMSFHFEMDRDLPEYTLMLAARVWYQYDADYVYVPMFQP